MTDCPICLEEVTESTYNWKCPECEANFHLECLRQAVGVKTFEKPFCPSCKRQMTNFDMSLIIPTKRGMKEWLNLEIRLWNENFIIEIVSIINEWIEENKQFVKLTNELNTESELAPNPSVFGTLISNYLYAREKYELYAGQDFEETLRKSSSSYVKSMILNKEVACNAIAELIYLGVLNNGISTIFPESRGNRSDEYYCFLYSEILRRLPICGILDQYPIETIELWRRRVREESSSGVRYVMRDPLTYGPQWRNDENEKKKNVEKPKVIGKCTCGGITLKMKGKKASCSLCGKLYCTSCGELYEEQHKCDPDQKLSYSTIKKNSKPCPKCGVRIQRSEGCSQMFCTICHTGFDYNTGAIIKSNFHNPHRAEWLRTRGIANDGGECCGECERFFIARRQNRVTSKYRSALIEIGMLADAISDQISPERLENEDNNFKERFFRKRMLGESSKLMTDRYSRIRMVRTKMIDVIQSFVSTIRGIAHPLISSRNEVETRNGCILVSKVLDAFFTEIDIQFYQFYGFQPVYEDAIGWFTNSKYFNHFFTELKDEVDKLGNDFAESVKSLKMHVHSSAKTLWSYMD